MLSHRMLRSAGSAAVPAELRQATLVPHRQCSGEAQAASEHRDEQQQAKAAEIAIVKPEEPGPEDCCQVTCGHAQVGVDCVPRPQASCTSSLTILLLQ